VSDVNLCLILLQNFDIIHDKHEAIEKIV